MASDRCHKIDRKLVAGTRHTFDGRDAQREHWFLLKVTLGGLLRLIIVSPDTERTTLSLAEPAILLAKRAIKADSAVRAHNLPAETPTRG